MQALIKKYNYVLFIALFIGMPLLLLSIGNFQARTFLKNSLSLITIVAFTLILAQLFLVRSNTFALKVHDFRKVMNFHKILGYSVVSIFFFHPFFIVLPRYFEAGADPIESFIKMITTFESHGVILGLIAWVLMLILGISSVFKHVFNFSYKAWRIFHGLLSLFFIVIALWHSIELGRHITMSLRLFFISIATIGIVMLVKYYLTLRQRKENLHA